MPDMLLMIKAAVGRVLVGSWMLVTSSIIYLSSVAALSEKL